MKNIGKKIVVLFTAVCSLMLFSGVVLSAETWPDGPITLLVPWKAGGSADRVARNLAPFLEKKLGAPIVVQNQPGATGQIGTSIFLSNSADGNTILMSAQPYLSASMILQGANYKIDDFEVINAHEFGNMSISVKADSPFDSFDALNDFIIKNPNKISIGTIRGGSAHLLLLLLKDKLNWDIRIITYNSGAPIRTALLGGQIDASANGAVTDSAMKPDVRSLALSTSTKLSVFPDSPYINDVLNKYNAEVPEIGDMRFIALKKGTKEAYPGRYQKIIFAYKDVMNDDEYLKMLQKQGASEETAFRGPEKSQQLMNGLNEVMVQYKSAFKKK